jgi:hypothetical protein
MLAWREMLNGRAHATGIFTPTRRPREPRIDQPAVTFERAELGNDSRFDLAIHLFPPDIFCKLLKNMKWRAFLCCAKLAPRLHPTEIWVAFLHDPHFPVNGEEGACELGSMDRYHLPLRGKPDG